MTEYMKNLEVYGCIGKTSKFIDYPLLVTYIVLSLIGLVMVYSNYGFQQLKAH